MRKQQRGVGIGTVVAVAALGGAAATAQSAITNGDFGAGFSGWTTAGLVTTDRGDIPGTFGPLSDPVGIAVTPDSVSGQAEGGVSVADAATLLGTTAAAINGIGVFPSYGAVITQVFTAAPGEVLTFQWNFVSLDAGSADFGFVYLDGPGVSTLAALADTGDLTSTPDYIDSIFAETGVATFTSDPLAGGTYRVGVGAFNSDNLNQVPSFLMVDNFTLTAIPEPASVGVVAMGALVGVARPLKRARLKRE